MKSGKTYWWICILLWAGFSSSAKGLSDSFLYADSLFVSGNFELAAIEYERIYFRSDNEFQKMESLLRKTECYKGQGEYALAENCAARIPCHNLPDSLIMMVKSQVAFCAYLAGNFENANLELIQAGASIRDSSYILPSLPLHALILNEQGNWEESQRKLLLWAEAQQVNNKDSIIAEIKLYFTNNTVPKLKDPVKAVKLSTFIPGVGQMYAGYFWEGLGNATLQVLCLGSTAYLVIKGYYVTAAVIPFGLFQKFYIGSRNRIEYLVARKNHQLVRSYNDKMRNEMILKLPHSWNSAFYGVEGNK